MSGKKTIPPEYYHDLRQMYERGDRLAEIAVKFGVTARTLRELLNNLSLPARTVKKETRQRVSLSATEITDLLKAYADHGNPVQDILDRFDIPLSRLYVELQKAGQSRRKLMPSRASAVSSEARSRIVKKYVEGASSVREIAASEGLNYDQVYVVLREDGVALKAEKKGSNRSGEDVRQRFKILYADSSVGVAEILAELNLTQHDVKILVTELQLVPRGKGGGKRSIPQSVIHMMPEYARRHEAGESIAKLANEAGIGLATMKVRLKQFRR